MKSATRKNGLVLFKMKILNYFFVASVLMSILFLSGCSYNYIDDNGTRHIFGLVNIKLEPTSNEIYAGEIIDLRTFGISINKHDEGGSISIGYSRDISGNLKNNVLVLGNPFKFPDNIKDDNNEN